MSEPLSTMARGNAMACPACDPAQRVGVSGGVAANVLFLERPGGLDGVEVGRIGREVEHAHATERTERSDSSVVVCLEVVQDQHVATPKPWKEVLVQPFDEAVGVGRREHRIEHDPASDPDRTEQGEVWAPVHRRTLDVLGSLLDPGTAPGHGNVEPGFVDEDQPLYRDPPDLPLERLSLGNDVRPQLLQRPEAFFLTTYPARYSARLMLETWRRALPRRPRLYSAVISPAVASPGMICHWMN